MDITQNQAYAACRLQKWRLQEDGCHTMAFGDVFAAIDTAACVGYIARAANWTGRFDAATALQRFDSSDRRIDVAALLAEHASAAEFTDAAFELAQFKRGKDPRKAAARQAAAAKRAAQLRFNWHEQSADDEIRRIWADDSEGFPEQDSLSINRVAGCVEWSVSLSIRDDEFHVAEELMTNNLHTAKLRAEQLYAECLAKHANGERTEG